MSPESPLPPGISVLIPVYFGGASLPELVSRLGAVLADRGGDYEAILVDDGSGDDSWDVIQRLAAEHAWVRGWHLMRNFGQHNALLCALRAARFATCATLDDDLQNPPEELPKLLAELENGRDVVYGRPAQEQHGLLRDLASQVTKVVLQRAMGAETAGQVSAFRVFRTGLRDGFASYRGPFVNLDVLLTWSSTRFGSVVVRHERRALGASNYTLRKLVGHALNMLTGFSLLPLRVASLIGFAFTLFGAGVLLYVGVRYLLQGSPVPGFPFLASLIAIFSGAQLFAVGVLGEYLGRIYLRSMEQPAYVVRATTPAAGDDSR
jgi:glycosyltransferase involved in cell wall biosynthesis